MLRVAGELIVRRTERGMPCEIAVLRAVDELARMLYSRAECPVQSRTVSVSISSKCPSCSVFTPWI